MSLEGTLQQCFTVAEFCLAHKISRSKLYLMWNEGKGPRTMRIGDKRVISFEAAAIGGARWSRRHHRRQGRAARSSSSGFARRARRGMNTLDIPFAQRLGKLIRMLSSDRDGEVVAAAVRSPARSRTASWTSTTWPPWCWTQRAAEAQDDVLPG